MRNSLDGDGTMHGSSAMHYGCTAPQPGFGYFFFMNTNTLNPPVNQYLQDDTKKTLPGAGTEKYATLSEVEGNNHEKKIHTHR